MVESALWHIVSEEEKEEIRKNAKKIMDEFADKLEKINVKEGHFESFENPEGMREEGNSWETDKDFRSIIFCNAPDVDGDLFKAEKGGWK